MLTGIQGENEMFDSNQQSVEQVQPKTFQPECSGCFEMVKLPNGQFDLVEIPAVEVVPDAGVQ